MQIQVNEYFMTDVVLSDALHSMVHESIYDGIHDETVLLYAEFDEVVRRNYSNGQNFLEVSEGVSVWYWYIDALGDEQDVGLELSSDDQDRLIELCYNELCEIKNV